jgi:hypothetical protein
MSRLTDVVIVVALISAIARSVRAPTEFRDVTEADLTLRPKLLPVTAGRDHTIARTD